MVHKDSLSLVLSGAGVTLVGPGLTQRYIAAANQAALEVEQPQSVLGEGPCLTVFHGLN